MNEKINIKLIITQIVSLFFLISGLRRFYIGTQGKKFDAIMNNDYEKFSSLTTQTMSSFLTNIGYWTFGTFLIGALFIGLINWKMKIEIKNTILVLLIIFFLFPTGLFTKGIINRCLNYFCGIFANNYGTAFLIGGSILTFIGLTILWSSIKMKRKTS